MAHCASMSELLRDTVFGHAVRFMTKARLFQYAEEKDPSLWKQYLDRTQTKNMALSGHPEDGSPEEKHERESARVSETQSPANGIGNGANLSEESSQTRAGDGEYQLSSTITGQKNDPEQGRDVTMVTWFGDNDPEVRILLDGPEAVAGAKRATDAMELVAFQEGIYYL